MKKLFYLLFLLPLAFFASCDDDDDVAQVDLEVTVSGVTKVNNAFYTVSGNTVVIDGLTAKSLTDKTATVTGVRYYLDKIPIWASYEDGKFSFDFSTENIPAGSHVINITATVLQVDKSITSAVMNVPLNIVAEETELPDGAPEIGTYTISTATNSSN